jgi:hypothetical protein
MTDHQSGLKNANLLHSYKNGTMVTDDIDLIFVRQHLVKASGWKRENLNIWQIK